MPALLRTVRAGLEGLARRSIPLGSDSPELVRLLGGFGPTAAGVNVTEQTSLRLAAVWAAVRLQSSTVAALPVKVWRDSPSGRRAPVDSTLFKDPMNIELDLSWFDGVEFLTQSMSLWGNAYAFKVRNELGDRVVRLVPMMPGDVTPYVEENEKRFRVQGVADYLTPVDVLHIPGFSLDGVRGLSPIRVARETLGVAIAAEEAGGRMFDAGMLQGGFLEAQGPINEKQAEEAKQRWRDKVRGVAKAYEVAVLSSGFSFKQAQIPPKDAQWIESRKFGIAEVARIFGMPPALLFEYMETGNVEADKLGNQWLRFGLNQTLVRIEKRLSMHLLPRGQFVEFERGGLLQGTPRDQAEVEKIQIDSGVLTVDEARALHNRPPLPEAPPPASPPADGGGGDAGEGNDDGDND